MTGSSQNFTKKIFHAAKRLLVRYSAVIFILLGIMALGYVAVLFYLYAWDVKPPEKIIFRRITVSEVLYEKAMEDYRQREKVFFEEPARAYPNPF